MHLVLHLRGCGIPLVVLAQSCDPCRLLGLLHPASHGSDSSLDCRRVIHRTSPHEFDRHDLTVLSFKLLNENCTCMKSNICVRTVSLTSSSAYVSSGRVRNLSSSSSYALLGAVPSAQLMLTAEGFLWDLIALIAKCSRDLAPDVVLQIPLLLSAITGLTLQALHMTLVDDSFLQLNGIREHVPNIVDGN